LEGGKMATEIRSKRGLLRLFQHCSPEVRKHFEHLPSLLDNYPLEVALAYAFQRLEVGQNMALYCGVVRLHRADSVVARNALDVQHMTRSKFAELYETVFELGLPTGAKGDLGTAESTRDTIMHGGQASGDRLRNAIGRVLEFSAAVNKQLHGRCQLQPFSGQWRGFAGRLQKLERRTTRFMLKGMGFAIQ
jgi:hypothetical protein